MREPRNRASSSVTGESPPAGRFRENTVEKVRAAFLALEQGRRDAIEGYFRNVDEPGWQALVAFDGLLGEFQKILDTVLPDLGYRFRPLIPPDAPRGVEENVLPKIPLPGSAEESIPTIELRDSYIVADAPAGMPKFNEVVKAGQVLVGTIRFRHIGDYTTIRGVELAFSDVKGKRVTGELRIPKGREHESNDPPIPQARDDEPVNIPFTAWISQNTLLFGVNWNLGGGSPWSAELDASMEKGSLSGKITSSSSGDGRFSFVPKK